MGILNSTLLAALVVVGVTAEALADEGDPSFGVNGRVVLSFDQDPQDPRDLAWRAVANGDHAYILGMVSRPARFVTTVTRLRNDGSPDDGYGTDGTVFLDSLDGFYDDYRINDIVLDGQGRIVGAGFAKSGANTNVLICRFESTGELDLLFGGQGSGCNTLAVDLIANGYDSATSIAVQPNGRIVIGGFAHTGALTSQMLAARFTASGLLDSGSFGQINGKGYTTVAFATWNSATVASIALDPAGRIVLGGTAEQNQNVPCDADFAFARLLPDGKIDNEFSGDGRVVVAFDLGPKVDGCYYYADVLKKIVVLPDSSIIAAGQGIVQESDHKLAMVKLDEFGASVDSFGDSNGQLSASVCDVCFQSSISHMAITAEGGFLISGHTHLGLGATSDIFIMRRLADGTPDLAAGDMTYLPFIMDDGDGEEEARGITIQNGRPLLVGHRESPAQPGNYDMIIARLQVDLIFSNDFELEN